MMESFFSRAATAPTPVGFLWERRTKNNSHDVVNVSTATPITGRGLSGFSRPVRSRSSSGRRHYALINL